MHIPPAPAVVALALVVVMIDAQIGQLLMQAAVVVDQESSVPHQMKSLGNSTPAFLFSSIR